MRGREPITEPGPEDGLSTLVSRLVDDARAYASAEAAVLRETAAARGQAARNGVIMVVLSLALTSAAIIALIVGLLMTVSGHVGPLLATAIVVGVTLIVAGLLGWVGVRRVKAALKGDQ